MRCDGSRPACENCIKFKKECVYVPVVESQSFVKGARAANAGRHESASFLPSMTHHTKKLEPMRELEAGRSSSRPLDPGFPPLSMMTLVPFASSSFPTYPSVLASQSSVTQQSLDSYRSVAHPSSHPHSPLVLAVYPSVFARPPPEPALTFHPPPITQGNLLAIYQDLSTVQHTVGLEAEPREGE